VFPLSIYAAQGLHGMLLFLVSSGLTLVFGMMGILDIAHAAFYMLGAYLVYTTVQPTGNFWPRCSWPHWRFDCSVPLSAWAVEYYKEQDRETTLAPTPPQVPVVAWAHAAPQHHDVHAIAVPGVGHAPRQLN